MSVNGITSGVSNSYPSTSVSRETASKSETKKTADALYDKLQKKGVEVLYDDRSGVRAGQMFADADLLGVPIRVVVSPRNLKDGKVEILTRDKALSESVDVSDGLEFILKLREQLYAKLQSDGEEAL